MSKQAYERSLADDEAKAVLGKVRVSPQKLGLVAGTIRGLNVGDAITQLEFSSKRISQDVKKLLQSAIANAENNHGLDIDTLYVKEAWVGKAMVLKRFSARARGRGARIVKPFSNITIIVKSRGAA
jgi:large subunit ribosomal protein L22